MAELNIDALTAKSVPELIQELPLWDIEQIDAREEARRQTIRAIIEEKLTTTLSQAIERLNRSTTRLTIVGWGLTVVGLLLSILSILK